MKTTESSYKGYRIFASAAKDRVDGLWNGRYRIVDMEGKIAFESFVPPLDDEADTLEAAHVEAQAWIDGDTSDLLDSMDSME